MTSVTYSCGICGLSSVESDSCFSEPGSTDLSLESPHGFGELTSQGGLGKGICSFSMFCVVLNLPFFSLVLTACSSTGRLCIDIPVQLLSCWRCWHITGICGKPSLLCVWVPALPMEPLAQPDHPCASCTHSLGSVLHC